MNLYPFVDTVASGAAPDECVEQIDIGGPSMVRAAAKNHPSVAVVTSPARYADVLAAVADGGFDLDTRKRLAGEAFAHTAAYDVAVASWFASVYAPADDERVPAVLRRRRSSAPTCCATARTRTRRAALYTTASTAPGLAQAEQLHGKPMSYNNYVDADAARRAAYDQPRDAACVAIIKHANPCGIAVGADIAEAHRKAHACDPVSAFGGVIATNAPVTTAMAEQVAEIFTEVVVAPAFEPRGGRDPQPQAVDPPARRRRAARRHAHRAPADQRRPAAAAASTRSTPRATTRRPGRSPPARPPTTRRSPTSRSRGGPAAR